MTYTPEELRQLCDMLVSVGVDTYSSLFNPARPDEDYPERQFKNWGNRIRSRARQLRKDWPRISDDWHEVLHCKLLFEVPLEDIPLHTTDPGEYGIIAKWRLTIGK